MAKFDGREMTLSGVEFQSGITLLKMIVMIIPVK